MKVYFIEVGVLIKNHEEEFDKYNIVYDHLYGYYDEDQYDRNRKSSAPIGSYAWLMGY